MTQRDIERRTLNLIEEIACERSGMEETAEERAWTQVYMMVHHAMNPRCRQNHPDFGRFVEQDARERP